MIYEKRDSRIIDLHNFIYCSKYAPLKFYLTNLFIITGRCMKHLETFFFQLIVSMDCVDTVEYSPTTKKLLVRLVDNMTR